MNFLFDKQIDGPVDLWFLHVPKNVIGILAEIWCFLLKVSFGWRGRERQRFQLFESASFGGSDLLFKDVTEKLSVLMEDMDMSQVLGLDYVALLKGLGHEGERLLPLFTYRGNDKLRL